jgi:transposase
VTRILALKATLKYTGGMITVENEPQILPAETLDEKDKETLRLMELLKKSHEEISWLKEQIATLNRMIFGPQKIKPVGGDPAQMYFPGFNPNDATTPAAPTASQPVTTTYTRKKPVRSGINGLQIPEDCPVERTIIDLSEDQKVDPETGESLMKIGEVVTRRLAYRPGSFFVKETVRYKYASMSREESGVAISAVPDSIIPKSRADESLLAEIITRKYADHLPLYRLEEIFSRDGVHISRQLMSQWIIRLGMIFSPLYKLMWARILASGNVFIDETPVKLQVQGKGKLQTGFMWVLVGGLGPNPPYRIFRFFNNRAHEHAREMVKGFSGSLHSDKLEVYQKLGQSPNIIWHPCWEHAKRKFQEMIAGDLEFRDWIVAKIQLLALLEREAWEMDEVERLIFRKARESPIIDEIIKAVTDKVQNGFYLPKSKYREALYYIYGLIPFLKNYLDRPYARMDNNTAERAIRPLAIGRKNWLFVGSEDGGEASATLFSLVQTCRGLGINPNDYLEDIMLRFLDHPINKLEELLPDNWARDRGIIIISKPLHVRTEA